MSRSGDGALLLETLDPVPFHAEFHQQHLGMFRCSRRAGRLQRFAIELHGAAIRTVWRDKETGEINFFPADKFEWVLKLNTVGTFRCLTRSAAGMMTLDPIDGERGVFVNTASAAACSRAKAARPRRSGQGGIAGANSKVYFLDALQGTDRLAARPQYAN